jgi:preprotein translocase subunit SecF
MVRVPTVGAEQGASLSASAQNVESALRKANLGNFKGGRHRDRRAIGRGRADAERDLGLRPVARGHPGLHRLPFEFSFAAGAVIATLHDVLVTFAFLAFFRYDLSLNVIAALLTVTGYSTNDTIVISTSVRREHAEDARELA